MPTPQLYNKLLAERDRLQQQLDDLSKLNSETTQERDRLKRLLNTPLVEDFYQALTVEQAHQREKWAAEDQAKTPADWVGNVSWLAAKAATDPHKADDDRLPLDRKLHRIIAAASCLFNWWRITKARGH